MKYVLWVAMTGFILAALASLLLVSSERLPTAPPQTVSVPFKDSDIETRIAGALDVAAPPAYNLDPQWEKLARAIVGKMKNYPAEYNKPDTLMLGDSTAVQLVIKTNEQQKTEPYFKDLEGKVTPAIVQVASDVSAQLTGPSDRLQIALRGDKMRTILSPVPITWVWDVKPLKPGPAQVTLEVTSYVKTGKRTDPVPIRVLQDTWIVDARGIEWAKYQIEQIEPIRAFLFAMVAAVVAVLAWFGLRGWGGGKTDFET